jgi:hypothetical protein
LLVIEPIMAVRSSRHAWFALSCTLVVQFCLQAYFFPAGELLTSAPLYYIDSPFHQYQMEVARQLCARYQLVGYDPFFAAGYLGGVTFNASAKLPAAMQCLVGSTLDVAVVYKIFSFAMGVFAPAALVVAGMLLRLDARSVWILAVFATLNWWTGPIRWYHTAGLVSYVTVAHWVVPFAVLTSIACRRSSWIRLSMVGLAAAFGTLVHPLFVVAATLLCAPLLLGDLRGHGGVRGIAVLALWVCGFVLAINGAWLIASMGAANLASGEQPYQRLVDPMLAIRELLGTAATAAGGSRFYVVLVVGAIAALVLPAGSLGRPLLMLVVAAVGLMVWASIGALSLPVAALQPNRFSALAWIVLAVPAAWGASALWPEYRKSRGARRAACGACLAVLAGACLFTVRDAGLEVFSQRDARFAVVRPEVKRDHALSTTLVDWLRNRTTPSARVYFETSLGRIHDRAHMAGIYALQSQREFIGGPYPFTDFASAWDGFAFGRRLETLAPTELARYLDLYNVQWMLCHSSSCRLAMAALTDTREVATIGAITAFERAMTPSYFLNGSGVIRARCINRLDIETPGDIDIVLKYHWVPGLAAQPTAVIEQRFLEGDPRPFIAIRGAARNFSLGVGGPSSDCVATAILQKQ